MMTKIEKRPPLTMEPSIDDPLAAVKNIMCHPHFSVNNLQRSTCTDSASNFTTPVKIKFSVTSRQACASFSVTPAQAGVQSKDLDSRFRGNNNKMRGNDDNRNIYVKTCHAYYLVNEAAKLGGVIA